MKIIPVIIAAFSGALFGFGLSLSGMLDPARVIGFLDIAGGRWDPSLAFVLGGALMVAIPGTLLMRWMRRPILAEAFHLPNATAIDRRLLTGSALFGLGWGMAGFCPGPALASLSLGLVPSVLFVVAMLAGMVLHDRFVAGRPS